MIVAIDGPSGSGKSTISKRIAKLLNLVYIDTGAIYRTLAFIALEKKISLEDSKRLGQLSENFPIKFQFDGDINHVFFAENDITDKIRTPEISMAASKVSAYPEVRAALLGIQRTLGYNNDSILEGRDIGTVVFPDADYKIFLTASNDIRAIRRQKELSEKGTKVELEDLKKQIMQRDKQDSSRDIAPLKKAKGAFELDTSDKTIDEVVDTIIRYVQG